MKKKFILGISLLVIIFFLFSLFIFQSLKSISEYQNIKNDHQIIMTTYLEMLKNTQRTMIRIHQYKPGLKKEFDSIIQDVAKNDDLIFKISNSYKAIKLNKMCNECHNADQKVVDLSGQLHVHQEAFKSAVNPVITSTQLPKALDYQTEALSKGDTIIQAITDMWLKSLKMITQINSLIKAKEMRAQNLIGIFLFITIAISLMIIFFMTRAISTPVIKLAAGIKAISQGKFDSKIDLNSHDEFGYIASNINAMADNLKKLIRERDEITSELNALNSTLEERVLQKTQDLERMHNNLIRTEGLAIAGTVASSVAHELSTPFSTLKGYCDLLSSKIPTETGLTKYCSMMEQEIDRCLHIMRGMTNLSRIHDDEKSLTDINALIRDLLLFISLKAKSSNISVSEELDPAIPHIHISTLGIRQVFMNIIINAIEAMPEGGKIRIASSLSDADKKINVSISDTGPGIPESELNKIFKTFYTTKKTGTGLGLSICHAIIKAHEGDLMVSSESGKGTTFDIILPL